MPPTHHHDRCLLQRDKPLYYLEGSLTQTTDALHYSRLEDFWSDCFRGVEHCDRPVGICPVPIQSFVAVISGSDYNNNCLFLTPCWFLFSFIRIGQAAMCGGLGGGGCRGPSGAVYRRPTTDPVRKTAPEAAKSPGIVPHSLLKVAFMYLYKRILYVMSGRFAQMANKNIGGFGRHMHDIKGFSFSFQPISGVLINENTSD